MNPNNRRTFLKNLTISGLGIGLAKHLTFDEMSSKSFVECDKTTQDYYGEGPFYTDGPPLLTDGKLSKSTEVGQKMIISGRVLNLSCNEFIPNTIIDVWHANDAGAYDNAGYNLRGYVQTNEQGFYLFETIKPGKYLNGGSFRPSHIHYKITPPGFSLLTTQLYFEGDDSIPGDAAASITSGNFDARNRIISLSENADGVLEGVFDIVINGNGISVGTSDLHLNTGMVYSINPNPFIDEIEIKYGVFKRSQVGLVVYDLQGKEVAILENSEMTPGKYSAFWSPDPYANSGHYFIALKINDLQVHYLKVIKQ